MLVDGAEKGGRAGGKKQSKKQRQPESQQQAAAPGTDGVAAWSHDSVVDFAADQALLQAARAEEAALQLQAAELSSSAPQDAQTASAMDCSDVEPITRPTAELPAIQADANHLDAAVRYVDGSLLEGGGQVVRNCNAQKHVHLQ
jgi:hypothetical protein